MTNRKTAIVVLAAGLGTRMKSRLPKVMHPIAGRPMIRHLLASLETLQPERLVVVVGDDMESVRRAVAPHPTVVQTERLGTGHAVLAAKPVITGFDGDVLIVYGDTPLLSAADAGIDAGAKARSAGAERGGAGLPSGRTRRLRPADRRQRRDAGGDRRSQGGDAGAACASISATPA